MLLSSDYPKATSEPILFDMNSLPDILKLRVKDVSDGLGTPPEMAAVAGIAILGGAISNKCGIRQEKFDDWTLIPNLWGAVIAPPGSNKSAAISAMSKPILEKEIQESKIYDEEYNIYITDKKKYDIAIKEYAKKIKFDKDLEEPKAPRKPKRKRFLINDATHEVIGEILKDADQGITALHDELGGLLASFGSKARAGEEARSFYLGAWDGDTPKNIDRIGRGSFFIENYCISVFGGIQPTIIDKLISDAVSGKFSDGLLERFQLFIYPEFSTKFHKRKSFENKEVKNKYADVIHKLLTMDPMLLGAKRDFENQRPYFRYCNEAQIAYDVWDEKRHFRQMEARSNKEHVFESSISKQKVLVGSLALIFHLFETAAGNITPNHQIDIINFERAVKLTEFLEKHMLKIYSRAEAVEEEKGNDIHTVIDWCRLNQKLIEGGMLTPSKIAHKINKRKFSATIVKEAISDFVVKWEGRKILELKF